MAEDSGAFKTNPAHSRAIAAFVIAREPLQPSRSGRETSFRHAQGHS
jgi:hypothetical protein